MISLHQLTLNCIREHSFPEHPYLANLIHQYSYGKQAPLELLKQIVEIECLSSNLLVEYLSDNMRRICGLEKCTIKNVHTVIKVCRYMVSYPSAFGKKPAFFDWKFSDVSKKVLLATKNIELAKPCVLIEMECMFKWHQVRNPKYDQGEDNYNKFLANPQSNQIYNFVDTMRLIKKAICAGLNMPKLHSTLLVPRNQIAPKEANTSTLQEYTERAQLEHLAEITQN